MVFAITTSTDAAFLSEYIPANLLFRFEDKQAILDEGTLMGRLHLLIEKMHRERRMLEIDKEIAQKVDEAMDKNQRATLRNRKIGFVFQNYNLLPKTTAIENVELPLMYNPSCSSAERRDRAVAALKAVGLGDRLLHRSNQMSGGQMQRVAIARALVNDPAVILADEATGNLDTRTSFEVLVLFQQLHAAGRTIIFVTHNPEIAQYSSRNITLRDGRVTGDVRNAAILDAAETLAQLPEQED